MTRLHLELVGDLELLGVREEPALGLVDQVALGPRLGLAVAPQRAREHDLGLLVQLPQLVVVPVGNHGGVDEVVDVELGGHPVERQGGLGRVEDHRRHGRLRIAAGKYGREQGEDEEEEDGQEADEGVPTSLRPLLAVGCCFSRSPPRAGASHLVYAEASVTAEIEYELRPRVET